MSDIFREVDEEVRRAQAEKIWGRYGTIIVAVAVLVVGAVGVYQFLEWRKREAANALGARFETALNHLRENRATEGEAALRAIAGEGTGTYQVLARVRTALQQATRDPVAAIAALDSIAGDAALDQPIRDVTRLRAAALAAESQPFAELERRLQPLTAAGSAVRFSALEILGAVALKAGDMAKAQAAFDSIIIDQAAPPQVKARAEQLIGLTRGR